MVYHCDRCRAVLPGGTLTCPQCGRVFEQAVPADAPSRSSEASVDDLLRNRTASSGFGSTAAGGAPAGGVSAGLGPAPGTGQVVGSVPRRRPVWAIVTAGAAFIVLLLTLIGWGVSAAWMRGKGGEIAYRQHNLAGNAAAERSDFAKADDEYGQMIALRPRRVDGFLLRAISEAKEGQPAAAIDDNTAALTLAQDPEMRGDLYSNRAESYAKQSKFRRAIADFTQANTEYLRERDPRLLPQVPDRRESVYSLRADAYWHLKAYARSIADSKAAIVLGHVHPDDYGVQAEAEAALGQDKAAMADFAQALRMDPVYLNAYIGLANVANKHHQYAQAAAVYQRAIAAVPDNAQFWGSLGWFQYESGQSAKSLVSDRHAQALNPNQPWVNYNTALTYAALGRSAETHAAYADALAGGTAADQKAGLTDLRNALALQPSSAVLRAALLQVQGGSVGGPRTAHVSQMPSAAPAPSKPPAPPARFAALLAPEIALAGGYGLQPPAGYALTQHPAETLSGSSTVYLWSGPRRADGTTPTLEAVIGRDDGSLAAHESERQVTQDALTEMGDNYSSLRVSAVSAKALGGLSFESGEWDGIGQQTGKEYQGSEYWSVTPSHVIHLATHDALPYSRVTLPLLQASLKTFRKI